MTNTVCDVISLRPYCSAGKWIIPMAPYILRIGNGKDTTTTMTTIKITYRNPLEKSDTITIPVIPFDNALARDWKKALYKLVKNQNRLDKGFCFHGFPNTPRNLDFLCNKLNAHIEIINKSDSIDYLIEEYFVPDAIRYGSTYEIGLYTPGLRLKHDIMNKLHNHFERLQGTVGNTSKYYFEADTKTRHSIGQLNLLCHEIESLVLSQRKAITDPKWVRPSQITSFKDAPRYKLTDEHFELFTENGYNRRFGHVYMHWAQIGKTLFEVFRDEDAPNLATEPSICEAITSLEYYSGEFDIELGRDVLYNEHEWHTKELDKFYSWLEDNEMPIDDPKLSLGYLPIAKLDLDAYASPEAVWDAIGNHFDVYKIQVDDVECTYDYGYE